MKMKKMISSLSIVLSITLTGALLPTSLAYAMNPSISTNKVLTREENSKIKSEIDVLNKFHVDTSKIGRVNVTENGNEYILKYKNADEKVIIKNSDTENTTIIVTSDKIRNELSFAKDGSITLDGFKVQVSQVEKTDTNLVANPMGIIYKSVKSLYPYGSLTSSDYNTYVGSGTQNINLGKAVSAISLTALCTLIGGINPFLGMAASLLSIAAGVKDVVMAANPTTQYLGCRWETWRCGSDDYEYWTKFYSNVQCTGSYSLQKNYEHFTIY